MLTVGEALWRVFRSHAQVTDEKLNAERVADWLLDYASTRYVLPRALRAAAICDVDLDPPAQTDLQRKIDAWGIENYRKLTAVADRPLKLSEELLDQRADSFGYWLAHPFPLGIEQRACAFAKSPLPMFNPYEDAMRRERQLRERHKPRPTALYPC